MSFEFWVNIMGIAIIIYPFWLINLLYAIDMERMLWRDDMYDLKCKISFWKWSKTNGRYTWFDILVPFGWFIRNIK